MIFHHDAVNDHSVILNAYKNILDTCLEILCLNGYFNYMERRDNIIGSTV